MAINELRVLVVEDTPFILELVVKILALWEAKTVLTATDGEKAVEVLKTEKVDCVISDFEMPNMNGLRLLRSVRQGGLGTNHPDLFFILVSAKISDELRLLATHEGANKCFEKPWKFEEIKALLEGIKIE